MGNITMSSDTQLDCTYVKTVSTAYTIQLLGADITGAKGKSCYFANLGSETLSVKVPSGDRGIINGVRIADLNYAIPQYGGLWCHCIDSADSRGWEFVPTTPEHIRNTTTRLSTDPNTYDKYEEATFTPTATFGSGSATVTLTGSSVKNSQAVNFSLNATFSAISSPSSTLVIGALPYTSFTGALNDSPCNIEVANHNDITGYYWRARVVNNSKNIAVELVNVTNGALHANTASFFTATSVLKLSGYYRSST